MIRQAVAASLSLFTAAQNDDMNDDDDEQPPFIARFLLKKEELLGDLPWYYLVGAVVIALWVTRKLLKCIRRRSEQNSIGATKRRADGFDAGRRARRSGVQLAMVSARFRSAANVLLGCFHLPPSSQSWTFQSKGHVAEGAVLKHS